MLDIVQNIKPKLQKVVEHYQIELGQLRVGRASAAMVENLLIENYGMKMPLKQLSMISIPDPKTIAIQPWDKSALKSIEKAITESHLGLNPLDDGNIIRLNIPPLTEESRKSLVKVLGTKTEEARISIRTHREELWREIQEKEKTGEIPEDNKFKAKEDLQKIVDEYNEKIKGMYEKKEKEIMTV